MGVPSGHFELLHLFSAMKDLVPKYEKLRSLLSCFEPHPKNLKPHFATIFFFHKCGLRFSVRAPEHHVRNPTTHPFGNGGSWNKAELRSYRCFFTEGRSRLVNFLSFPTKCPENPVEKARAAGRDARRRSRQGTRREFAIASRNLTRQVPVGKRAPPANGSKGDPNWSIFFLSGNRAGLAG